ncbi:MAG: hypothetical protein HN919_12030 [Verrucomicrobia bacterium]|nr:hypothetical protein [Verrucomicrobiota bacterium]MBT7067026.1 hypothetical protein [Verrucomicrobiota bacterium]MBT7702366.1 hypothetical protein [Verrucomicrobiota bacterium]
MRFRRLLVITCAAVAGGCFTARRAPLLIVANASGHVVSHVSVETDGATLYTAPSIDSHSAAHKQRFRPSAARTSSIRWTRQGGETVERTVQLEPPSPKTFRGKIYIQIETNATAKVFFLEDTNIDKGVLPWTARESWEGSPSIPGLNQE